MHNRDFDREHEAGILRSGKRYKSEGKESNTERECNSYLENTTIPSLWGDSEDHSVQRPTTPEQPKTPEVNPVTPPLARSGAKSMTQGSKGATPPFVSNTMMVGGEMKLPVFHGNGSEDPQQHWLFVKLYGG